MSLSFLKSHARKKRTIIIKAVHHFLSLEIFSCPYQLFFIGNNTVEDSAYRLWFQCTAKKSLTSFVDVFLEVTTWPKFARSTKGKANMLPYLFLSVIKMPPCLSFLLDLHVSSIIASWWWEIFLLLYFLSFCSFKKFHQILMTLTVWPRSDELDWNSC